MNQRQLAAVLLAVLGLFIAASRLPEIFIHAGMLIRWNLAADAPDFPVTPQLVTILGLSGALLTVLVGAALALYRVPIAARLFPAGSGPLEAREVQAVGLSVLGCYFVIYSIQGMLWVGPFRWSAVAQAALGVGLFLGARGVAGVWERLRLASRSHDAGQSAD